MAEHTMNHPEDPQSLDARITLALETAPEPQVPADFAARLAAQLPAIPSVAVTPRRYGRRAAIGCVVFLLALLLLFALHPAVASPLWNAVESIFCLQLALIAVWLAVRDVGPYFRWRS
jgi:hypothetical protein